MFRDVRPEVTEHKLALLFILRLIGWFDMEGACPGGSVGNTDYRECWIGTSRLIAVRGTKNLRLPISRYGSILTLQLIE
jgi:hypothetical protein